MKDGEDSSAIDFVVTWVDGNDPEWQSLRRSYCPDDSAYGNKNARFRDWDTMRYWFRGVEKFTPWVRRIHFVTCGHLPPWLDTSHPKLNIVRHSDFIPPEFLPTFNTNAIELNIHRIPGLCERFAYFNDDVFVIKPLAPNFFFDGGLPCDYFAISPIAFRTGAIGHIIGEDMEIVNDHFTASESYSRNRRKMLSATLGWRRIARNMILSRLFRKFIPGFAGSHVFVSFLKSTFDEVWREGEARLSETCQHRFRTKCEASVWAMRYWQLAKGDFSSVSPDKYRRVDVTDANIDKAVSLVANRNCSVICVNDNSRLEHFDEAAARIRAAFDVILPDRCGFELGGEN